MRRAGCLLLAGLTFVVPLAALAEASMVLGRGGYAVTPTTAWNEIKNPIAGPHRVSILAEPPDGAQLDLTEAQRSVAVFGVIQLGSPARRIYMASGPDFLYVDANSDGRLRAEDRVEMKRDNPYVEGAVEIQRSESARSIPCQAAYARANGTVLACPVMVQFYLVRMKPVDAPAAEKTVCYYFIRTWFKGIGRFVQDKREKELAFALLDGNGNATYNDYGSDILLIDADADGAFDMTREAYPLLELEETTTDGKNAAQARKIIFPWPRMVLVQPSRAAVDWSIVEPN